MSRLFAIGVVAAVSLAASSAIGQSFGFGGLSTIDDNDTSTGEDQIVVDVFGTSVTPQEGFGFGTTRSIGAAVDEGVAAVDFVIRNREGAQSSIIGVYFEGPAIFQVLDVFGNETIEGPGVLFSQPADPQQLPLVDSSGIVTDPVTGEPMPDPEFTTLFSTGADAPTDGLADPGINPGEFLTLRFALLDGVHVDDVIALLTSGEIRIGLLVTGFEGGGIETFVNNPDPLGTVVPAPLAFGTGLLGLGFVASRRRRHAA